MSDTLINSETKLWFYPIGFIKLGDSVRKKNINISISYNAKSSGVAESGIKLKEKGQ